MFFGGTVITLLNCRFVVYNPSFVSNVCSKTSCVTPRVVIDLSDEKNLLIIPSNENDDILSEYSLNAMEKEAEIPVISPARAITRVF